MKARQTRQLPDSLLKALRRLDYHKLGVIENLVISLLPDSPEVRQQQQDLRQRYPVLRIPLTTPREAAAYDAAIRGGADWREATDKVLALEEARRRRARQRTEIPQGWR
jgi:hypothetical protein